MHNRFDSLLKRCKKRKRALMAKRVLLALFGLIFLAGALYVTNSGESIFGVDEREQMSASVILPKESVERELPSKEKPSEPKPQSGGQKSETKAKAESKPGREAVKEKEMVSKKALMPQSEPKSVTKVAKESLGEVVKSDAKAESDSSKNIEKSSIESREMAVLDVKEVTDIDSLVKQYNNSPRYPVALKIAQVYYDEGDFENASLWARKANLLERDDERAWLIYAQSEYALGREERAKRILQLYLDYKESPKARSLLITWSKD